MIRLDAQLGAPLGYRASFGLIVLRADETIEHEARQVLTGDGIAHYVSRVPCETEISLDSLARMEGEIPRAAALLPSARAFDVVAYACTSGATRIGPDRVDAAIRKGTSTRHTTNPLSAALAAMEALKIRSPGFVTPYAPEVSQAMLDVLEQAGITIAAVGSMLEPSDERVARIDGNSIKDAVRRVAGSGPCDGIFLSCTNLRALSLIAGMEAELGIPVLTSNQALLWHIMQLASQPTTSLEFGALMQTRIMETS
ncbi:maleate cis-trans isomerase family protein [Palleronia caenipelagi]|uniref:Asp/Glu racemase n=1 Tax=Palleronia caenipelagi TaxID=2489174 RepID=A0A547PIW1_9RHOB|nr:Asp/Glu racemase [Palleronia caenipelagi]TRD14088.1 Asp/Glu racemase [Palleronia caenipelagi]